MAIILRAPRLYDGIHPDLYESVYIKVEHGYIVGITSSCPKVTPKDNVLSLSDNLFVMPGLINAHDHAQLRDVDDKQEDYFASTESQLFNRMIHYSQKALYHGITTVRDCGASHRMGIKLSRMIRDGEILGSRILSCGNPITSINGHLAWMGREVEGPAEIANAINEEIEAGANFIKITVSGGMASAGTNIKSCQFSQVELSAAVHQAHMLGRHIAAHAHSTASIKEVVDAGFDTIEHCTWVGSSGIEYDSQIVREIVEKKITVIATLATGYPKGRKKSRWEERVGSLEDRIKTVTDMLEAGVDMIVGTDDSIPGSLPYEMELLSKAGLDNLNLLRIATKHSADRLGIGERTGSVEVGKQADLIAIDGNPLNDIRALNQIKMVMARGVFVRMEDIYVN